MHLDCRDCIFCLNFLDKADLPIRLHVEDQKWQMCISARQIGTLKLHGHSGCKPRHSLLRYDARGNGLSQREVLSPRLKFPANREMNREFHQIRAFGAIGSPEEKPLYSVELAWAD
jgi:hypothetical protein